MSLDTSCAHSLRGWFPLSLVILLGLLLTPALQAQIRINGVPPSVTSLGFSPSPFAPGIPASVTSLGFGQPQGILFPQPICCFNSLFPSNVNQPFFFGRHHHHDNGFGQFGGAFGGAAIYPMPYYYPAQVLDPVDDSMEQDYSQPPAIFDSRVSGRSNSALAQQYDERLDRLERLLDQAETKAAPAASAPAEEPKPPAPDQPETVLVFRDGHSVQVKNYAIVGSVLYDFSGEHRRKIQLADLDLTATEKQNDDRGVDFRLPVRPHK